MFVFLWYHQQNSFYYGMSLLYVMKLFGTSEYFIDVIMSAYDKTKQKNVSENYRTKYVFIPFLRNKLCIYYPFLIKTNVTHKKAKAEEEE